MFHFLCVWARLCSCDLTRSRPADSAEMCGESTVKSLLGLNLTSSSLNIYQSNTVPLAAAAAP